MKSLLAMDPVEYSLFRANECANDLMDRLIDGAGFDALLQIRREADALMMKFAALSESAQYRAVKLTQQQTVTT